MTKDDEIVTHILMAAARDAGYEVRRSAEGFIGVIGPAKVCRLMEYIHAGVVAELERREG